MTIGRQKITPFLWFDDRAEEAVALYTSIFRESEIVRVTRYGAEAAAASGRPEGSVMTMTRCATSPAVQGGEG